MYLEGAVKELHQRRVCTPGPVSHVHKAPVSTAKSEVVGMQL